jgi:ornithine--oxo-acid transaminase
MYAVEDERTLSKLNFHSGYHLKHSNVADQRQAKPTHQNIIRLAPPLVITEDEVKKALIVIGEAVTELPSLKGKKEDEVIPDGEKNVTIKIDN